MFVKDGDTAASLAGAQPQGGGFAEDVRAVGVDLLRLRWGVKLFLLGILLLYIPVVQEAARIWLKDENQAHGVFIFPIVLFLLWVLRDEIRAAKPAPSVWGLAVLGFGLLLESAAYLMGMKWFPMLSLIPVLAGGILVLHGRNLWKVLCFPVLFTFFAAPLPDAVTLPLSARVQRESTTGAVVVMKTLGYTLVQTGNRIDTPTVSVEVAEVCSGFKKLTALVAFSLLYGFMFPIGVGKRAVLVASAYPIALFANVVRICGLIAIGSAWGDTALHVAHDWAELFVLVISFVLFTLFGKALGCTRLKYSL